MIIDDDGSRVWEPLCVRLVAFWLSAWMAEKKRLKTWPDGNQVGKDVQKDQVKEA